MSRPAHTAIPGLAAAPAPAPAAPRDRAARRPGERTTGRPTTASLVLLRQLSALHAWVDLHHRDQQHLIAPRNANHEQRQVLSLRAASLHAEATALRAHCSSSPLHTNPAPRAVLIHRRPWLTDKLTAGLTAAGVQVTATATDGGTGSGTAIAEAPDLVFLEASLPTMTGRQLTGRLARCSPSTRIAVQANLQDEPSLRAAGATAVWSRSVRYEQLIAGMLALLDSDHPPPG